MVVESMVLMPDTMETRVKTLTRNIMARLKGSCLSSPRVRLCDVEKEEYDHLDRMSKGSVVLALSPGESDNRLKQRRRKAASVAAAHLFPLCPPSPSL